MVSKGGLRERLRSETRRLHDALEGAVAIERRLQTRHDYILHLVQLRSLHVAVEHALRGLNFTPVGFAYPFPYRARLLESDLAALGVSSPSLSRLRIPPAPQLNSLAAGLGCIYVVEGSAKGARAILPHIRASLGLDAGHGASYFAGLGRETGRLWQAALAAIERIPPRSDDADNAVAAAIETFDLFHEGLLAAPSSVAWIDRPPRMPDFERTR